MVGSEVRDKRTIAQLICKISERVRNRREHRCQRHVCVSRRIVNKKEKTDAERKKESRASQSWKHQTYVCR